MSEQGKEPFEEYGVVELTGRQRIAGLLTEEAHFGTTLLRVDVPAVGEVAAHTKYFGAAAIYCVNITSEDVARTVAASIRAHPVLAYDNPLRQRSLPVFDGDEFTRCSACGEKIDELGQCAC
jgi:hypothetical protein